ncbi:hypothetical protein HK102_010126 [Quaeritorhiza haematococci]|nr:hypothetical protein HK102_010126 [Quaeritorhiza haematococci]
MANVVIDGRDVRELKKGEVMEVKVSPYPVPCVNKIGSKGLPSMAWVRDINAVLKFNQSFANTAGLRHTEDEWPWED